MKTCTKCGQEKAVREYRAYRGPNGRTYRRGSCRECERARHRNRHWERRRDPEYWERHKERERDRYANSPEYRNRQRALQREYSRSPEGLAAHRAKDTRRRARKRGLPDDGSGIADWLSHMEESDVWHCHLCGGAFAAEDEIHWDHRDPISTGTAGTVLSNMAAAHAACNISRGNTPLREWSTRVGLPEGVV